MDGHSIKLFSRKEMKAFYLSKDKTYGKAIRTFYTQDQASKKPLFAKVAYSGATVAQVTPQLFRRTKKSSAALFFLSTIKSGLSEAYWSSWTKFMASTFCFR
jgi:hypothetical protein